MSAQHPASPRGDRRARKRGRAQAGFTIVEVMMAMALLTAGAAGIFALQQASILGNVQARQMTIATTVARTWVERLKRDALGWNRGANAATAGLLASTRYLNAVPAVGTDPVWMTPAAFADSRASYDHLGREVALGADVRFCVQYRLQWVNPGQAIRADVRVWWHRRGRDGIATANLYANCGVGNEAAIGADPNVHIVNASTVLRWVPR
jgi:prepilin-type N-terminal cleavage/methylation domain-containing protein